MNKGLKLCALFLGCALVFGCVARKGGETAEQKSLERFRHSYEASLNMEQEIAGQKLLKYARSAIGTPYVRGGSLPGGFDCSGFVSWAFKNVGIQLPRTAREQSVVGKSISNIEDMRAGDIVAFRHPKRGYHTGIYVGDGKFIHSPRKRTSVRINSLSDPYFSQTLLGARRVTLSGGEDLVAQAESRLASYAQARKAGNDTSAAVASASKGKGNQSARVQKANKVSANKSAKPEKAAKSEKAARGAKPDVKKQRKNSSSEMPAQKTISSKSSKGSKSGNSKAVSSLSRKSSDGRS